MRTANQSWSVLSIAGPGLWVDAQLTMICRRSVCKINQEINKQSIIFRFWLKNVQGVGRHSPSQKMDLYRLRHSTVRWMMWSALTTFTWTQWQHFMSKMVQPGTLWHACRVYLHWSANTSHGALLFGAVLASVRWACWWIVTKWEIQRIFVAIWNGAKDSSTLLRKDYDRISPQLCPSIFLLLKHAGLKTGSVEHAIRDIKIFNNLYGSDTLSASEMAKGISQTLMANQRPILVHEPSEINMMRR